MKNYYFLSLLVLLFPATHFISEKQQLSKTPQPPIFQLQEPILTQAAKQQILAHNLWDKQRGKIISVKSKAQQSKKQQQSTSTNWKLKAVRLNQFAIIKHANKIKSYSLGETLPDGSELKSILIDGIIIQQETTTQHVYLFGKKS